MATDISTNPFDGRFALVNGDNLIAERVFRALIEAGIVDLQNEQLTDSILTTFTANAELYLSELEEITVSRVTTKVVDETVYVEASVKKVGSSTTLNYVIDVSKLTIDKLF